MLSSSVREILATTEAVIVDEIHAVAQTKRGAHLALTLERLDRSGSGSPGGRRSNSGEAPEQAPRTPLRRRARHQGQSLTGADGHPADRVVGHAAAVGADRSVPGRAEAGVPDRRRGAEEGARPGDRRAGRGHVGPGRSRLSRARTAPPPTEIEPSAHVRSIWPAIYPKLLELVQEHTSTIIFVNNRRASERLAKRLNELANGEGEQELPPPSTRATQLLGGSSRGWHGGGIRGAQPAGEPLPDRTRASCLRRPTSRSPAPTTARSPTRSGPWSRRC